MDKLDKIKSIIAEKGITKAKVAEKCGINAATLSKILSKKIDYVAEKRIDLIIEYLEAVNTNDIVLTEA